MSNLPAPPTPPSPHSAFVTSLAWSGLIGGVLCFVSGIFQLLATQPFAEQGFIDIVAQLKKYAWLSIGGAIPLLWVSWGLLKRKDWARKGMIALIVIGVLSHLALVPILQKSFGLAGEVDPESLAGSIIGILKWVVYGGLAFATAAMIWLGRKLAISPIKDEFS